MIRPIEGQSGEVYYSVEMPDPHLGKADTLMTRDQMWVQCSGQFKEDVARVFSGEQQEFWNNWIDGVGMMMEQGVLTDQSVCNILNDVLRPKPQ